MDLTLRLIPHSQRSTFASLMLIFVLLTGCEAIPVSIRISIASPTSTAMPSPNATPTATTIPHLTATSTPSPAPQPSPTATSTPRPTVAAPCGARIEVVDSSDKADLIRERMIPYLQELEICGARARIEIIDGENVGREITGGGELAGAYTWCYPRGGIGERARTIIAVGQPYYDQWNTYLRGWVAVGEGMYPSEVLLHELYHVRQCLVTGEVVEDWSLEDEYPADSYALDHLEKVQAAPIIVFID